MKELSRVSEKPEKSEPMSMMLYLSDYQVVVVDVACWLRRVRVN